MTSQQIREEAKSKGFHIVIETDSVVVVKKPRKDAITIKVDEADEKSLGKLLDGWLPLPDPAPKKEKKSPKKAKKADKKADKKSTPLSADELEAIKGIGPKTASAIASAYDQETLIQALKDDLDIEGVSASVEEKLKKHFNL